MYLMWWITCTSHLSLAGANSTRRPPSLTPRLCTCPPSTTIPPPNASVPPIIVESAHNMHAIYSTRSIGLIKGLYPYQLVPMFIPSSMSSSRAHTSYNNLLSPPILCTTMHVVQRIGGDACACVLARLIFETSPTFRTLHGQAAPAHTCA